MIAVTRLRRTFGGGIAVDLGGELNLVGALVKYLGIAFVLPTHVALGYGEPPWPFVVAGALTVASAGRSSG